MEVGITWSVEVEGAESKEEEGVDEGDGREGEGNKEAEDDEVATGGDLKLGGEQGTSFEALGDPTSMLLGVLGDPTEMQLGVLGDPANLLLGGVLGLRTGLPNGALILR